MHEERTFGPPGCGKTTWLSRQVGRAAHEFGANHVVVGSFTRAAALEVASRDLPIPRENVGTLHAFAYRLLDRPTIADSRAAEWNELRPEWELSVGARGDDDDPGWDRSGQTRGDTLYASAQVYRARMLPPPEWPSDEAREFHAAWGRWKQACGYMDFTDLIETALTDVECPSEWFCSFWDEAQDFSALELALVRKWARGMEYVVLVGDDDQCLYRFKGASPGAFLLPPIPAEQKRTLEQSYRCPRATWEYANGWSAQLSRREPKRWRPRDADGSVRRSGATWKYPGLLLDQIEQAEGTSMILASCSYLLGGVLAALRDRAIPYHNPYRRKRGDWNPLQAGRGVSAAQRVLALLRPDRTVWGSEARLWHGSDVKKWADPLRAEGVFQRGQKAAVARLPDEEPVSYDWLWEALEPEANTRLWNRDLDWYEEHLLEKRAPTLRFPLALARRRGAAVLRETPRVVVGTVHSVKGGEADHVFLFPDLSLNGYREWLGEPEARDAVIRMVYVGATRAREELVLCSPATPLAVWA